MKTPIVLPVLIAVLLSALRLSAASTPERVARLDIEFQSSALKYDRNLFGQFIEHFHRQIYGGIFEPGSKLSDAKGFRLDVVEALRELKVPVVRWPGGCFVSSYHWKLGVGKNRIPAYDKSWNVEDPNTFGTDEFIEWCRLIGAEPFICTNAGTGTPEEMSDWVEYCNLPKEGEFARQRIANGYPEPHRVKYWSVGNENYGDWEMGAKTIDEWGYFVRESAKLMFNVDHGVKLFAAALADEKWTIPLLERAGKHLDYVSIHEYWDPLWRENNPTSFEGCMLLTTGPEKTIRKTIAVLQKTGFAGKIKIAFDEWNLRGWHHPRWSANQRLPHDVPARDKNDINSTYTMADALFSACFLNACLRNASDVTMACMAPVVNARGPLFVHPGGLVKRTTFHVMKLYANNLQPNVLPHRISSPLLAGPGEIPMVDAIVTCDDAKTITAIALVNKSATESIECALGLGEIDRQVEAIVLSGDSPDAYNDIAQPDRVVPQSRSMAVKGGRVLLPPHSLVILSL